MVGEIVEIFLTETVRNTLNCPPWLEKILNLTCLKSLGYLKLSSMVGENVEFYLSQIIRITSNCPPNMVGENIEFNLSQIIRMS